MGVFKRIPPILLLAAAVLTTWAGSVRGTKMTVEESVFVEIGDVFAAARHLQSMQNAPASVTLVTEADIDRCGYRTLTEQAP